MRQVDWELVAQRSGHNDADEARTRFGQINKIFGFSEDGAIDTPTATKERAKKEKGVGSGTYTTPSKVKKPRTPRKPKISKTEVARLQVATHQFLYSSPRKSGLVKKSGDHGYIDSDAEDS